MVRFIDEHRGLYGVESICRQLEIAPSTYYEATARSRDPERRPARAKLDELLMPIMLRVWRENFSVYGARKLWKQLRREGIFVARCTVERLMRVLGIAGVVRRKFPRTTRPGEGVIRPEDLVLRKFSADAPNRLWVADLTYVPVKDGFVYTAFIVDVFSRRIVGWKVSTSLRSDIAIAALDQATHMRTDLDQLVHHSDRGTQYLSVRYMNRPGFSGDLLS